MTAANIAAKITPALQQALLTTVDALMRRRACDVPEQTIEQLISLRWLQWSGGSLRLTEAGETTLSYARRILSLNDELLDAMHGTSLAGLARIGCPQDFATILPGVLSQFTALYPRMQIELRIEGNAALADAVGKSQLDMALTIGHEDRAMAKRI